MIKVKFDLNEFLLKFLHEFVFNFEFLSILIVIQQHIWEPPSLSVLTTMIFNMGLTHLGSEAFIYDEPIWSSVFTYYITKRSC